MNTFLKNNWLDIVGALIVFCGTASVKLKLLSLSGIFWWILTIFFCALFISGIYEITVKVGVKEGHSKRKIILRIVLVWILPLLIGYIFAIYLINSGKV